MNPNSLIVTSKQFCMKVNVTSKELLKNILKYFLWLPRFFCEYSWNTYCDIQVFFTKSIPILLVWLPRFFCEYSWNTYCDFQVFLLNTSQIIYCDFQTISVKYPKILIVTSKYFLWIILKYFCGFQVFFLKASQNHGILQRHFYSRGRNFKV